MNTYVSKSINIIEIFKSCVLIIVLYTKSQRKILSFIVYTNIFFNYKIRSLIFLLIYNF